MNTTTLAIILTIVVTNWTEIGEFKDRSNRFFSVQEGQIVTNTVVDVLLDEIPAEVVNNRIMNRRFETTNRFVLKSVPGSILAERKAVLIEYVTNWFSTNVFWTTNPIIVTPTNKPIQWSLTNLFWLGRDGKKKGIIPIIKLED